LKTNNCKKAEKIVKKKYLDNTIEIYSEMTIIPLDIPFESPYKKYREIRLSCGEKEYTERYGQFQSSIQDVTPGDNFFFQSNAEEYIKDKYQLDEYKLGKTIYLNDNEYINNDVIIFKRDNLDEIRQCYRKYINKVGGPTNQLQKVNSNGMYISTIRSDPKIRNFSEILDNKLYGLNNNNFRCYPYYDDLNDKNTLQWCLIIKINSLKTNPMVFNLIIKDNVKLLITRSKRILPNDNDIYIDKILEEKYKTIIKDYFDQNIQVKYIDYNGVIQIKELYNPFYIEKKYKITPVKALYFGIPGETKMSVIIGHIDYDDNNNLVLKNNDSIVLFYSKEGYNYTCRKLDIITIKDKFRT